MNDKEIKKIEQSGYSRGYQAGRRKTATDIDEVKQLMERIDSLTNQRRERIYLASLEVALKHCNSRAIGGKRIDNAEGYSKLAKIFTDNAISMLDN